MFTFSCSLVVDFLRTPASCLATEELSLCFDFTLHWFVCVSCISCVTVVCILDFGLYP